MAAKHACLRVGQICKPAYRRDYVVAGFECRRRKGRWTLARAGEIALRHGGLVKLQSNGRPTLDRARQVFAKLIRPLPGVRVRPGVVGQSSSGTLAIGWLLDYRSKLPAAQRAVLNDTITPKPAVRKAASTTATDWDALVRKAQAALTGYGLVLHHTLASGLAPYSGPVGGAEAFASPNWQVGQGDYCAVFLTPAGEKVLATEGLEIAIHEVIHCATFEYGRAPAWVEEGFATYAAAVAVNTLKGGVTENWWGVWFDQSQYPLFERTYDAVGFWGLLKHVGLNPFQLIEPAVRAGTSARAYAVVTQDLFKSFAGQWGAGLASFSAAGNLWDLTGPGNPVRGPLHVAAIANGSDYSETIAPRSGWAARLDISADIVSTQSLGAVGFFRPPGGTDIPLLAAKVSYCTRPGGCSCDGKDLGYKAIDKGSGLLGYASTSIYSGARVIGESLADHCQTKGGKKKPPERLPTGGIEVHGPVNVDLTDPGPLYVRFARARCTKSAGFHAILAASGSTLEITLKKFHGPDQYVIPYSGGDPRIVVKTPKGTFTNSAPARFQQVVGFLLISKPGVGLSHLGLFDRTGTTGVTLVGAVPCTYPKPKR